MYRPLSISPPTTDQHPNPRHSQHSARILRPRGHQNQSTPTSHTLHPTSPPHYHARQLIFTTHKILFSYPTDTPNTMEGGNEHKHEPTHLHHPIKPQNPPNHTTHTRPKNSHSTPKDRPQYPPTSPCRSIRHTRPSRGRPKHRHKALPLQSSIHTTHPQKTQ
jgi:hypothetical protein